MNVNSLKYMPNDLKKEFFLLFNQLSKIFTISLASVISLFLALLTGYYLDSKIFDGKTYPYLTIVFFFIGLAAGAKNIYVLYNRFFGKGGKVD